VEEIITLIDQIIEEHRVILQGISDLEPLANDVGAVTGFREAEDVSLPISFERKQNLPKLDSLLEAISQRLRGHFNREETALLSGFHQHGDARLLSAFQSLLSEHEDIRNHLVRSRNRLAQLNEDGLSRREWEARADNMRAAMTETRELIAAHAGNEQGLLLALRRKLLKEGKTEN
jgi:iron-sulfur cluster repair protein YtfE (RIC family)